jgi:hypothetical protein
MVCGLLKLGITHYCSIMGYKQLCMYVRRYAWIRVVSTMPYLNKVIVKTHSIFEPGNSQPALTSAPRRMNDKWLANIFLLGGPSSLLNYSGYLSCSFTTYLLTVCLVKQLRFIYNWVIRVGHWVNGELVSARWLWPLSPTFDPVIWMYS